MSAYREPEGPASAHDPEAVAIATLRSRAGRARTLVHVPLLLLGLALGGVLYVVFRDWQFASRGAHFPWVTAACAFAPTFGLALWGAPRVSNALVGQLMPGWRASLAQEHGLDLAELTETTRLLD